MKVLNLCCAQGHGFEGWFGSEDDFQAQLSRGVLTCPLCADTVITRLPSAPRLNLSGAREPVPAAAGAALSNSQVGPSSGGAGAMAPSPPPSMPQQQPSAEMQALWLQAVQHVLKNTDDVGERFPEEARRMHYGETEHRGIRGQASAQQRAELAEEGIEVMPLPMPAGLNGPRH